MSDAAVTVQGVSKRFKLYTERNNSLKAALIRRRRSVSEEFWAVRDVSFDVEQGTTFGLVGENGSGKSTMLKCLTGILRPDAGSIEVRGKVSALLELGAGFHPELSGRENVFLNGAILGMRQKEIARRFDEIVHFAGVERFIDEPVKNYSSGMYVRLGFSVAINVDPEVLLVDEVLAVGDEAFQRKSSEKFAELKRRGTTIVLVSHAMGSVQALCDRVAWFEHGSVRMIGTPRDVIEAYTEEVDVDRHVDAAGRVRHGSGEAQITDISLLGLDDQPLPVVKSGGPLRVRLAYQASTEVVQPDFTLAVTTVDGFPVTGPSTLAADCVPDVITGSGVIDVDFDRLRLLPGTYDLSVSITDRTGMHTYDSWQRAVRIDVERGSIHESYGVVSIDPTWRLVQPT